jgi:hypothetical protein
MTYRRQGLRADSGPAPCRAREVAGLIAGETSGSVTAPIMHTEQGTLCRVERMKAEEPVLSGAKE